MKCWLKDLRLLLLLAAIIGQVGCATSRETSDDPPALEPSKSHDDSHGWGTAIQGD